MRDRPSEAARRPGASGGAFREAGRIRAAHDCCQPQERRRGQAEFFDHHIECAGFATMTPEHTFDVEWSTAELFSDRTNFRRRDEQEKRVRIDKEAA